MYAIEKDKIIAVFEKKIARARNNIAEEIYKNTLSEIENIPAVKVETHEPPKWGETLAYIRGILYAVSEMAEQQPIKDTLATVEELVGEMMVDIADKRQSK